MRKQKQIVITGYSMISALGLNKEENRKRIFAGEIGSTPHEYVYKDKSVIGVSGAINEDLGEHSYFKEHDLYYDRASQLALMAVDECMEEAQFSIKEDDPLRVGVVVGTSLGGMLSGDIFHTQWIEEGIDKADSKLLEQYPLHAIADVVASHIGANGAKVIISTACSSAANAVGLGRDLLQSGMYDVVLAGGIDPLSRFSFSGFSALKAIVGDNCKPYCESTGINLGEGAAFFLLESDEHASKRNAKIIAELSGYAITGDAYHPTAPDITGKGAIRSMTMALENAGKTLQDVDYINGHGTGTPSNDNAEKKAWKSFVQEETHIPLVSNKAALGHCMGAAGAVETAISIMSIQEGKIPPTANFNEDSEKADGSINFVPNKAMEHPVKNVISNSFAFGGNNCSLLLSEYSKREEKEVEDVEIVITGIGCLGTGGISIEELWETFKLGTDWIEEISTEGKDFTTPFIGKMPEVNWKKYIPANVLRRVDGVTKMAMAAGKQALQDSKLKVTPKNATRIGVIYGTGTGPLETIESISRKMISIGIDAVDANTFPNSVLNAAPGQFSIANMLKGPNSTISSGSVSGLNAFIYATELLKNNQADAIVVLTADEWNEPLQVGNEKCGLLTKTGAKPFSQNADGMALSAGATAFVLERAEHAMQRGAHVKAKVLGYAMTSDNGRLGGFDEEGNQWVRSLQLAKTMAGNPEIDYYASTAYGVPVVDRKEVKVMKEVLSEKTQVSSIPSLIGAHSGSLGTYGLLSGIYTMENSEPPKSLDRDEALIDDVKAILERQKTTEEFKCVAVSAASFGGAYTSIIIGK